MMTAPTMLVRGRAYVLDDRNHAWRQRSPGDRGPTGTFLCLTCGAEAPTLPGPQKCRRQLVPLDWLPVARTEEVA